MLTSTGLTVNTYAHDLALRRVLTSMFADHTELHRQFFENESFRKWLTEMNFSST